MRNVTKILSTSVIIALLTVACGEKDTDTKPDARENSERDSGGSTNDTIPAGWVDLGLPSGLLWAECNLGADAPEEYGDYYAWGETSTKESYTWQTYVHCNGSENKLTKYCTWRVNGNDGFVDSLFSLQPEDDVALQTLGNGAHIPTVGDWRELLTNTQKEWVTVNDVLGLKLSGNGNVLFLPAAGRRWWTEQLLGGEFCCFWTDSLSVGAPRFAWTFFIMDASGSSNPGPGEYPRYEGLSVRAVRQR